MICIGIFVLEVACVAVHENHRPQVALNFQKLTNSVESKQAAVTDNKDGRNSIIALFHVAAVVPCLNTF